MKLRNPAGNRSYLMSMLISFLAILLIPLALFSFVLRNHFFHVLQEEISKNNLSSLEKIVQQAEDDMEAMQQIVNQVSMTPYFYGVHDLSDYSQVWSCRQQLSTLLISSQRFRNIVISWEGIPAVLSNSGSCSLMLLKEDDPLRPQYDQTTRMRVAKAITNPINTADDHQLVFSWPVNFVRPASRAELNFYLDTSRYYDAFIAQRDVPVDYLVYHCGEKMTSSQNGLTLPEEFIHTLQQQEGAAAIHQVIRGKNMLICAQSTAGNELLFISMMPASYAMSIAGGLQRELMLCNIVCVLLALLVICISVRLNYRPLQRLLASVEHLVTTPAQENEITSIQQAVDTLKTNNEELRIISRQTTINHLMGSLLGGAYTDKHSLPLDKLAAFGFPLGASGYIILIIKVMNPRSRRVTSAALTPLVNRFFPACLVKEDTEPVVLAALNGSPFTDHLETLRQAVAQHWDSPVTLSASRPFTSLIECAEAYSEAVCSLDYRFIRGNDSLLLASEMNLQEEWMDHYPHQDLAMLRRMLNTRNLSTLEQIDEQLDSILEYIRACEVPMFAARMICFDVVNVVLSSMSDAERFHNRVHLTRLSHFETVDEMLTALSQLCHNLFALTEPDTADVSRDLTQQMLLYIDCNFTDSNFSLQEMADYFHMSMANLSQYFKRKTGQTLISYYTNLRMEKARQLLNEGTLKLDEVAEKVGYLNTSSFVRRFKQFAGMSPTRWQEENQKGGTTI